MDFINTAGALIGAVIGAAFLVTGGILLPLWQWQEERQSAKEAQ